jgi:hypothetical protein
MNAALDGGGRLIGARFVHAMPGGAIGSRDIDRSQPVWLRALSLAPN